jgi:hypothetical protein
VEHQEGKNERRQKSPEAALIAINQTLLCQGHQQVCHCQAGGLFQVHLVKLAVNGKIKQEKTDINQMINITFY